MKSYTFLFAWLGLTIGCATHSTPNSIEVLPDQGPAALALNPKIGDFDQTVYKSASITKNYLNGQIAKKVREEFDFEVESKVKGIDTRNGVATYQLKTLRKDGNADLSDYAMPELGDTLELVLNKQGEVVRAGDYPKGTLYYVPPVSFPKGEVKVGDTWDMSAEWMSLKSGIPLQMQVVSVLKNIRDCNKAGRCAEIEISGDVTIAGAKQGAIGPASIGDKDLAIRFKSEIKGRMIVSLTKGSVLYSIVRNEEALTGEEESVQISSCMLSYVTSPQHERILMADDIKCDPTAGLPTF